MTQFYYNYWAPLIPAVIHGDRKSLKGQPHLKDINL